MDCPEPYPIESRLWNTSIDMICVCQGYDILLSTLADVETIQIIVVIEMFFEESLSRQSILTFLTISPLLT